MRTQLQVKGPLLIIRTRGDKRTNWHITVTPERQNPGWCQDGRSSPKSHFRIWQLQRSLTVPSHGTRKMEETLEATLDLQHLASNWLEWGNTPTRGARHHDLLGPSLRGETDVCPQRLVG